VELVGWGFQVRELVLSFWPVGRGLHFGTFLVDGRTGIGRILELGLIFCFHGQIWPNEKAMDQRAGHDHITCQSRVSQAVVLVFYFHCQ
jgi:hypothetical protein